MTTTRDNFIFDILGAQLGNSRVPNIFYDFIVHSEFGNTWAQIVENDAFMSSSKFDDARRQFQQKYHTGHRTDTNYYKYVSAIPRCFAYR